MRTSVKALLFSTILIVFVGFSCSEGEPVTKEGPFNISELAGNWEATSAILGVMTVTWTLKS